MPEQLHVRSEKAIDNHFPAFKWNRVQFRDYKSEPLVLEDKNDMGLIYLYNYLINYLKTHTACQKTLHRLNSNKSNKVARGRAW